MSSEESKYTKGNWEVLKKETQQTFLVFGGDKSITNIKWELPEFSGRNTQSREEAEANANLIASAPSMYEALKKCREWFDKHGESYEIGTPHCFINAKKILAKAEGKTA